MWILKNTVFLNYFLITSYNVTRLSMIVSVNIVLNRTVVDSD